MRPTSFFRAERKPTQLVNHQDEIMLDSYEDADTILDIETVLRNIEGKGRNNVTDSLRTVCNEFGIRTV